MPLPTVLITDLLTVTRGGSATVINAAGSLVDVAAGQVRFDFSSTGLPQGILIEGPDTNHASNPLWSGAVAGTPPTGSPPTGGTMGSPPTGVTVGGGGGISAQIVGVQEIGGEQVLAVRYYGTRSGNQGAGTMSASNTYATTDAVEAGFTARVLAGDPAQVSLIRCAATIGGVTVNGSNVAAGLATGTVKCAVSKAANSGGTNGNANFFVNFDFVQAAPIDVTIGFSSPFLFKNGRPGQSYIRPASAAVGASSRARDDLRFTRQDWWDFARLVSGANVGATVVLEFMLQQLAQGTDQGLLRIDDATTANRLEFYNLAGTNQIWARRVINGTVVANLQLGTFSPMVPFRLVLSGDDDDLRAVVTGGDITMIPLAGSFVAARALLGSITTDDTTAMWGWFRYGFAYPKTQPNATLLLLTTLAAETIKAEGNT